MTTHLGGLLFVCLTKRVATNLLDSKTDLSNKRPLASAVLAKHRQFDAHGILRFDGVSNKLHNWPDATVATPGLQQEANFHLSTEAGSGNVATKAGAAAHIVNVDAGDKVAAVRHVVFRHEIAATQNSLASPLGRRLSNGKAIKEEHWVWSRKQQQIPRGNESLP